MEEEYEPGYLFFFFFFFFGGAIFRKPNLKITSPVYSNYMYDMYTVI